MRYTDRRLITSSAGSLVVIIGLAVVVIFLARTPRSTNQTQVLGTQTSLSPTVSTPSATPSTR